MPYEASRSGPQTRDIALNHEYRCSVAQEIGSPSVLLCPFIVNWARSWLLLAPLSARAGRGEGPNMARISPATRSWSHMNTGKKITGATLHHVVVCCPQTFCEVSSSPRPLFVVSFAIPVCRTLRSCRKRCATSRSSPSLACQKLSLCLSGSR
jgi:hypothetical protein